jgi:hypothetical protein
MFIARKLITDQDIQKLQAQVAEGRGIIAAIASRQLERIGGGIRYQYWSAAHAWELSLGEAGRRYTSEKRLQNALAQKGQWGDAVEIVPVNV